MALVQLYFAWAIAASPPDSLEQAESLLAAGRHRDARALARQALGRPLPDAEAAPWWWVLAQSFKAEGDPEEARAALEQLIRLAAPESRAEASLELAGTYLEMWNAESARQILESPDLKGGGAPVDPRLADRQAELLAICLYVSNRETEAWKSFLALPRKGASTWHYLGLIAFHQGDYRQALDAFNQSLSFDPKDYYSSLYRGWCLLELNRLEEGRAALEELARSAGTAEAHQLLGRLELRAERFAEAETAFREALRRSPDLLEAQFGLATALRRAGKKEAAQTTFEQFEKSRARQEESMKQAYALNQRFQANPRDAGSGEALARHYLASGDHAAAERQCWRVLKVEPGHVPCRLTLARAYSAVGRFREAAVHYQRILRDHPGHPGAEEELRELIARHARKSDG